MKTTKIRRLLSVLLACVLVAGMIPVSAHAVMAADDIWYHEITDEKATITGYFGSATEIVIPESVEGYPVTAIGASAFAFNEAVESVYIPSGVTVIGDGAFSNCNNLKSVTFPDGLEDIGAYAFKGCSGIEVVDLPESIERLGEFAFEGSAYISDPDNWEDGALYNNKVLVLTTEEIGSSYSIKEGTKVIADGAFSLSKDEQSYVVQSVEIPESVVNVGSSTFYNCAGLESIVIPKGITSIGGEAFMNCRGLKSVTIPASLAFVDFFAFCECTSLETVYFEGAEEQWTGIFVEIGNDCLLNANVVFSEAGIDEEIIPEGLKYTIANGEVTVTRYKGSADSLAIPAVIEGFPVTSIGKDAFFNCTDLVEVIIPENVRDIGPYAFYNCRGLKRISIPEKVESIGDNAFCNCQALSSVTIPESITVIGENAFFACRDLDTVYYGGNRYQWGCINIQGDTRVLTLWATIIFAKEDAEEGPNDIDYRIANGEVTVYEYTGDETVYEIPSMIHGHTVTAIGDSTFRLNKKLENVIMPDTVVRIEQNAFYGCSALKAVELPESLEIIEGGAFGGCYNLSAIRIPAKVRFIDNNTFHYTLGLESITVDEDNPIYHAQGNCLIETKSKKLVKGCNLSEIPKDGSVTSIGYDAFGDCRIPLLLIPGSVTEIGMRAFEFAYIQKVYIPSGTVKINDAAFIGCDDITVVLYGDNEEAFLGISIGADNEFLTGAELICSFAFGDINGDGTASSKDSNLMKVVMAGESKIESSSREYYATDLNGDGEINAKDSNLLKQIIAGVIDLQ